MSVVRVWVLAFVVSACVIGPKPPPAPPRQSTLGLRISSIELTNGLRVVLVQDPTAPEIQVTTQYRVGAADDPPEQAGMAHVVEHLMHQQVLGAQTLFAHLEAAASEFNAFTSFDATTYTARADASYLEKLLAIEAVRLGFRCTTITEPVFLREREVVANEVRERDHATEVWMAVHGGIYPPSHPYRRPVGGTLESVGSITFEQACAFADAHYAPANAVLVISGPLELAAVESALSKFLARVAKRSVPARSAITARPAMGGRRSVRAPIDDDAVVLAWPLPSEPGEAAQVRAVLPAAVVAVDREVKGFVATVELGDTRAPMVGILVVPGDNESVEQVIERAEQGLAKAPDVFARNRRALFHGLAFDRVKQGAIYDLYASLDEDVERDVLLARYALAGDRPGEQLGARFNGLRELSERDARRIVREHFAFGRATVVAIQAIKRRPQGRTVTMRNTIHDLGQRRELPDPDAAKKPAAGFGVSAVAGMKTRVLPNGMRVVLLPMASVPTVDIRLVFSSGTGDEPAGKRGVALAAANALEWNWAHLADMLRFVAAGGTSSVRVAFDHTTFSARGVDMHIDLLLAGIRRWVRDGVYDDATDRYLDRMRDRHGKLEDENEALHDVWRDALFGPRHPYLRAGLARHANKQLTKYDVEDFRAGHFTPANATLVIAGRFDAQLANRWVEFLFADWRGRARARDTAPAAPPPAASIAQIEDHTQLFLRIALPTTLASRAHQLVVAAMLDVVIADVRHQLGASYGVDAELVERRRASHYTIEGWIDAARAVESVQLLRERIEKLASDPELAARMFAYARGRVLTQLRALKGSAARLANRIELDVALDRPPMSDLQLAAAIQNLTIDDMSRALGELELSRAAVLARGPTKEIERAFAALGRTPAYVKFDRAAQDAAADIPGTPAAATPPADRKWINARDLEHALTDSLEPAASPWSFMVSPGYSMGSVVVNQPSVKTECCAGPRLTAYAGYAFDRQKMFGLQLGAGLLRGSYHVTYDLNAYPMTLVPVDVSAFVLVSGYRRLWGSVTVGLHLDRVTVPTPGADDPIEWNAGFAVGVHGGVDVVRVGSHRFGVYAGVEGALISGYGALTLGLAYRR